MGAVLWPQLLIIEQSEHCSRYKRSLQEPPIVLEQLCPCKWANTNLVIPSKTGCASLWDFSWGCHFAPDTVSYKRKKFTKVYLSEPVSFLCLLIGDSGSIASPITLWVMMTHNSYMPRDPFVTSHWYTCGFLNMKLWNSLYFASQWITKRVVEGVMLLRKGLSIDTSLKL